MTRPSIGLQLYTVRNAELPLGALLAAVADAGYAGVESVGTQGVEAAELRASLDEAGLELASAHVALAHLRDDLAGVAAVHRTLGTPLIVVPWLAPADRPGDAHGWADLGRELAAIGGALADEGLPLAYHHHDFELESVDGRDGLTVLAEAAGPERLSLELDAGWLLRVGHDPAAWLATWGGRVTRLHVKDLRLGNDPPWVDVGDGELDLAAVLAAADTANVPWLLVEHDAPRDPLQTMRRSAAAVTAALAARSGQER